MTILRLVFAIFCCAATTVTVASFTPASSAAADSQASAEKAGKSVSVTAGYLSSLGEPTFLFVQGIFPTRPSDNIFVGAAVEAPPLWKSFYPLVTAKWLLGNRYGVDEEITRYIETRGFTVCAGVGYGVDAWQATLRLQTAVGYWWENMYVNYSGAAAASLGTVNVANDQLVLQLSASLAFPFTSRVNALISSEFLLRPETEINGTFENGRWYRIETNGTYGTFSIGLTVGLGSK